MSYNDWDSRMKLYEASSDLRLPLRGYSIIRIDGKAFHTWTRKVNCARPHDAKLHGILTETAGHLVREIQDAKLAYVQSDEISILVACFNPRSEPWFGNRIQKISSVSASMATRAFNTFASKTFWLPAEFDSRCFSLPEPVEVYNYFLWRQRDAYRNAVQGWAIHHTGQKEVHGLSNAIAIAHVEAVKDAKFTDTPPWFRNGTLVFSDSQTVPRMFNEDPAQLYNHIPIPSYMSYSYDGETVQRLSQSSSKDGTRETVGATEERDQKPSSGVQTEAR